MRRRTSRTLAALVLLTLAACAWSAAAQSRASGPSFLWRVTRGNGAFYLAGSIHMLTAAHYPLSAAFDTAFAEADLLVEEVDYREMMAPEAQMRMLQRGMYPAGGSLKASIAPETYALVSRRMAGVGLPLEAMDRFKPWFLALTLAGMEWQQAGFDQRLGLDRHFFDRAMERRMAVQALETVDYQISRFDGMTPAEQDRLLASTLHEIDVQKQSVKEIADAWRAGDVATVERLVLEGLKTDPRVYERLLVERNQLWMAVLEGFVARPGRAFVVVGAAHLVGPDGLLTLLRSRGFTLEQL